MDANASQVTSEREEKQTSSNKVNTTYLSTKIKNDHLHILCNAKFLPHLNQQEPNQGTEKENCIIAKSLPYQEILTSDRDL